MIRRVARALLLRLANPKRGGTWTCSECQTANEDGRATCMNGCGTRGPLAPGTSPTVERRAS